MTAMGVYVSDGATSGYNGVVNPYTTSGYVLSEEASEYTFGIVDKIESFNPNTNRINVGITRTYN